MSTRWRHATLREGRELGGLGFETLPPVRLWELHASVPGGDFVVIELFCFLIVVEGYRITCLCQTCYKTVNFKGSVLPRVNHS